MKSSKLFTAILLMLASCAGNTAFAYRWIRCGAVRGERLKWDHDTVRFRAAGISFPPGTRWRSALGDSAGLWNRTPTNFRYHITFDEPRVGWRNDQNEIYFSDSLESPAITRFRYPRRAACEFKEVDIVFSTAVAWGILDPGLKTRFVAYFAGTGTALRPFQGAALHELGHAQGLAHEERVYNIMGQEWTHIHANGSTAASYPGVDAVRGSMDTYGRLAPGINQDLSIAHFKWSGRSGGYSMHRRTQLFDTSGSPLVDRGGVEPRFVVRPGQTIQVEFGYENVGVPASRFMVSYHLSFDDRITTADPVIATRFIPLEDTTYVAAESTRITLRLPTWLTPGSRYWLGATIDPWNVISEIDEDNNATYVEIEAVAP